MEPFGHAVSWALMAKVLLVEDDDLVRDMLSEELDALGHAVDCAKTKAEAEALLATGSYDLMFCDLVLPDGSGRQIARLAVELGITSILMTGYRDVSDEMLFAGILHLSKPFSLRTFRDVLEHHLGVAADSSLVVTKRKDAKRADATAATLVAPTGSDSSPADGNDPSAPDR